MLISSGFGVIGNNCIKCFSHICFAFLNLYCTIYLSSNVKGLLMITNTKIAFEQIIKDLRRADFVRCILTLLISIGYLSYRIASGVGNLPMSIILLTLHSFYLIFYVIISIAKNNVDGRKLKKNISEFYKWIKRLMLVVMAYTTIISVIDAPKNVTDLSIIFAILLPISLVLQIVFDLVIYYASAQIKIIKAGMEADLNNLLKPLEKPIKISKYLISGVKKFKKEKEVAASTINSANDEPEVWISDLQTLDTHNQKKPRRAKVFLTRFAVSAASAAFKTAAKSRLFLERIKSKMRNKNKKENEDIHTLEEI